MPMPNVKQFKKALGEMLGIEIQEISSPELLNLFSQTSPCTNIVDIKLHMKCEHVQLGFNIDNYKYQNRGYVHNIIPKTTAS
eukprot:14078488-Ditylum_brightwellii.AAC.1